MNERVEALLQVVASLPIEKQAEAIAVATAYLQGVKAGRSMETKDPAA